MSEFDPEVAEAFFGKGEGDGLLEALADIARGAEDAEASMKTAFEDFRDKIPENMKEKYGEISIDNDGHFKMEIDGKTVDLDALNAEYISGDFKGALEEMGFSSEALDTEAGSRFVSSLEDEYKTSLIGQVETEMEEAKNFAEKANLEEPVDEDDFKKICNEQGWNIEAEEKKFQEVKEELKEKVGDPPTDPEEQKSWARKVLDVMSDTFDWFKDFIKRNFLSLVLLALLIYAAYSIYDFIKSMQHALSGCFATDSTKHCKIYSLTCKDDDIYPGKQNSKVHLCYACEDLKCSSVPADAAGAYIPLKLKEQCTCDPTGKDPYPGIYNPDAETGHNTCDGRNPGKCPIEAFTLRDNTGPACSNASGCIARKEACDGNSGDCSKWCNSNYIHTRSGQKIECQQCSFWCAFGHTLGSVFSIPGDALGKIEKILIYVVVGIVVLIVGYWILKKLISWGEEEFEGEDEHGHSGHGDHTIHIKVSGDKRR